MKLNEIQLDAMREVANIGAGNAATNLSRLLEKRVRMSVTSIHLLRLGDVAEALGGAEQIVTGINFRIQGSASGSFVLLFSEEGAWRLAFRLLGCGTEQTSRRSELAESALKETANVFVGTYCMALSQLVNLRFIHSVPEMATDMLQAVLDETLVQLAKEVEHALVLETKFDVEGETIHSYALFIPDPQGLLAILEALHLDKRENHKEIRS